VKVVNSVAAEEETAVGSVAHIGIFNPLNHPVSLVYPARIDTSAWVGHLPFGMYLIDVLRPKAIAEQESHHGMAYCAFCQAVKECGGFARLIKRNFDEALEHFDDRTFDLLHIDGLHSYEAVKQHFEKWLPKLTDRGVVLLHDINVSEREFGVRKFWDEVKPAFPHFEFIHSRGLGVLAVGKDYPDQLNELFRCSAEEATKIRNFFACLGARLETIQNLQLSKEETSQNLYKFQRQLDEKDESLRTKDLWIQEMGQSLKTKDLHIQEMDQSLRTKVLQLQEMNQTLSTKDLHLQEKDLHLQEKDLHIQEMERGILVHLQSPSYRLGRTLTWPLRSIKKLFR
jgi:O-antigen biosynthesis protein